MLYIIHDVVDDDYALFYEDWDGQNYVSCWNLTISLLHPTKMDRTEESLLEYATTITAESNNEDQLHVVKVYARLDIPLEQVPTYYEDHPELFI